MSAIDKSGWGDGPWQSEPDRVEFDHAGLRCVLLRGPGGHWCGYVGVPKGHPLHGRDYSDPADALRDLWQRRKQQPLGENPSFALMLRALGGGDDPSPDVVFTVHGGLTYADAANDHIGRGDASEWFFGFDCAHSGDLSPKFYSRYRDLHDRADVYRTVDYARREAEQLAEQLAAVGTLAEAQ